MQRECRKAYNYYINKTIFNSFKNERKRIYFDILSHCIGIMVVYKIMQIWNCLFNKINTAKADVLNKHIATVFLNQERRSQAGVHLVS